MPDRTHLGKCVSPGILPKNAAAIQTNLIFTYVLRNHTCLDSLNHSKQAILIFVLYLSRDFSRRSLWSLLRRVDIFLLVISQDLLEFLKSYIRFFSSSSIAN